MRKVARDYAESEIEPKADAMEETGEFTVDLHDASSGGHGCLRVCHRHQ